MYITLFVVAYIAATTDAELMREPMDEPPPGVPPPGVISSMGDEEHSPPVYRPGSQAYAELPTLRNWDSQSVEDCHGCDGSKRGTSGSWFVVQQMRPGGAGTWDTSSWDKHNCLLCEQMDSGHCRAAPMCVYCETTVTALCDTVPCVRCSVIANPFFNCVVGERYMAECSSCRCVDGHSGRCGRCSRRYGGWKALELYAMQLSDGDVY